MRLLTIPDCSLGVVTDQAQEELAPGAWTDARNIRFKGGAAQVMKGISSVFTAPSVMPYWLQQFTSGTTVYWVHAGLAKVFVDDGTTRTEITGTAPTGAIDDRWTGGVFAGTLVMNNGVDQPMYWGGNTALDLATLPGWNSTWRAGFLVPWRTFLVAGNMTEGGAQYPHTIRVSDSAVPGSLPAVWTPADTADAVRRELADTDDPLVDAMPWGDQLFIYGQRSAYTMRETFTTAVVQTQLLPQISGMLARGCGAVTPAGHVVLTAGDVILHAGQGQQSIADDVVRKRIFAGIDATNYRRCFVTCNPSRSEVWVCFPESGQSTCTLAAVWNWISQKWAFRSLPNVTHGAFGAIQATAASDLVDSGTGLVDTNSSIVDETTATPNQARMLVCNASAIGLVESGNTDLGASLTAYVERYGLSLSDDNEQVVTITDIQPKISGISGQTVSITVGSSMTPSGDYEMQSPVTFTIGTDQRADVFASGRYFSLRIEGTGHEWSMRSLQINGELEGSA